VRRVEEVGEKEADDVEGYGDHAVPDETEEGPDGHSIHVDFVRSAQTGCEVIYATISASNHLFSICGRGDSE